MERRGNPKRDKTSSSLLLVPFFALCLAFWVGNAPETHASPVSASILVNAQTGEVLQASNADTKTYPASLTKMMTLYLLFEDLKRQKINLTDRITVSKNAAAKSATNLNLKGGETIDVETAILAVVVRSANDIATAIAERLGGSESAFAQRMTNKARQLGMTQTFFHNASGLPDPQQITTARDMAILGVALFRDFPTYYKYFSADSFTYKRVTYTGHNRVTRNYDGADGIKTGYIRLSGFNLVTSAKRNGIRLVGVVLGGDSPFSRDRQMQALLDRGFGGNFTPNGQTLVAKAPPSVVETTPTLVADTTKAGSDQDNGGTDEYDIVAQTMQDIQALQAADDAARNDTASPALMGKKIVSKNTNKAKKPVTIAAASSDVYGIQVGAYNKYKPARKAALKAAKTLKQQQARIVIDQAKANNAQLYRARLAGLSKKEAEQACRSLKSKGTSCVIIPGLDTVAASN